MDISKVKKFLPNCKLGEIRPCTTPGTLQFHLLVDATAEPTGKIINLKKLLELIPINFETKYSEELGVIKAVNENAELAILASGRVVLKKAKDEEKAKEILEELAPLLKESLF